MSQGLKVFYSLDKYITFSQVRLIANSVQSTHRLFGRNFCTVCMFFHVLTLYFTFHDRSNRKQRHATRLRTYVGNVYIVQNRR